jgi:hypothetical protein
MKANNLNLELRVLDHTGRHRNNDCFRAKAVTWEFAQFSTTGNATYEGSTDEK